MKVMGMMQDVFYLSKHTSLTFIDTLFRHYNNQIGFFCKLEQLLGIASRNEIPRFIYYALTNLRAL